MLVAATCEPTWEVAEPPVIVPSRVPGADFKLKLECWLPYQNPKLTRSIASVETRRKVEEKRTVEQKRKAVEDAKEAEFVEAF